MPSAVKKVDPKPTRADLCPEDLIPPNRDYITLTISKITATYKTASGKNETVRMERSGDMFWTIQGDTGVRWNNKAKKRQYPMSMWDEVYARYRRDGWILYDTQKREKVTVGKKDMSVNGKKYRPIEDPGAAEIVSRLIGYAKQMIEEEYQKTINDVPDWAFAEAKKCLDELAMGYKDMTNKDFNAILTHIFAVLPRRIDVMAKYIAAKDATSQDRAVIIENERERYNILHTMLRGGKTDPQGTETILDAYGIQLRPFTEDETDHACQLMGDQSRQFLRGWRVMNVKTEKVFNNFCLQEGLTESHGIDLLFHGSRSENWWSILANGLTINPIGVVITGKAYGYGTYFAPDAIKSLGYTDRVGAKWTNGHMQTGFLGIYKVATGNRYDGHLGTDSSLNWDKLQKIQPGAHCTWAKNRYSGFRMDEVIVYKDEQSTIWGLLEFRA